MGLQMHPRLETGKLAARNAAFVAFICPDVLHYADAPEDFGIADKKVTLLGMVSRWDSTQGFPGGMVEEGETLVQAAVRECYEEINLHVDPYHLHFVATHKISDTMNSHIFVKYCTREELYDIQRGSLDATHYRMESGAFIVHHIFPDSFQNLIESSLAKTVREGLYTLDQLNYL